MAFPVFKFFGTAVLFLSMAALSHSCSSEPKIKALATDTGASGEDVENQIQNDADIVTDPVAEPKNDGEEVVPVEDPKVDPPVEVPESKYHVLAKAPTKIWSIKVLDKSTGRLVLSGGVDWDDTLVKGVNEGFVGFSTNWGKDISYVIPKDPSWTMLTGWLFNVDCLNDQECWTAGQWCGVFYTPDFGKTWTRSSLSSPADRNYCQGGGRYTYGVVARSGTVIVSGTDSNVFRLSEGSKTTFWEAKRPSINLAMFNLSCASDQFCFSASRKALIQFPLKTDKVLGEDMSANYFRGEFSCEGGLPASYNGVDTMIADWTMAPLPNENFCPTKKLLLDNHCYDAVPPDITVCDNLKSQLDTGYDHEHSLFAASFLNDQTGYVLNMDGTIGKTLDGGKTFKVSFRAKKRLAAISMISEKVAYAGGEGGAPFKTVDGGLTWTQDTLWPANLTAPITAIYFADENHGYIGLKDGTLVYWGAEL